MAKRYCKKSSVQSVVNEVKTRRGSSSNIQGSNIASEISGLVLPTQMGAPSTVLTASNPSVTIQRGKYTGGSVSVVPQNATAVLSRDGGNVPIESGKTLASVTVPARNTFSYIAGSTTFQSDSTSFAISNVTFTPKGAIITCTKTNGLGFFDGEKAVEGLCIIVNGNNTTSVDGIIYGSGYRGRITSASMTKSGNNLTINSILGTVRGSSVSPYFGDKNAEYSYMIWGV